VPGQTSTLRIPIGEAPATPGLLVDVVVLTQDAPLFEAIRNAVGERCPAWRARSSEEAVEMLMLGRCGVLIVDMAAVSTQPASLIEQIHGQFPDVVVVVAGNRDDEYALAGLVGDGLIYRYMHKPLSEKRATMFLNASIRHYTALRGARDFEPLRPLVKNLPERVAPRYRAAAAAMILVAVIAVAMLTRESEPASVLPPAPAASDSASVATIPLADPVLSKARAAYAAGRYEVPAGRNALDLYRAVLLARPDNAEARAGLDKTIDAVMAAAHAAHATGDDAEAARLAARILAVAPDSAAANALQARLMPAPPPPAPEPEPEPERVVTTTAEAVAEVPIEASPRESARPEPVREPPMPVPATAPPPPSKQASTRPVPDPLQPKLAMAPSPKRKPVRTRVFGAPISSGLPIAGYDTRPVVVEPQRPTVTPAADSVGIRADVGPVERTTPGFVDSRELEQTHSVDPVYPASAMRNRTAGWVTVEFTVTTDGAVGDMLVTDSEPSGVFDAAATHAVRQWRFKPRLANGRAVAMRSAVTLNFSVDE
jgi:protein TonB